MDELDESIVKQMLWDFAIRSTEHSILMLDERGNIMWSNYGASQILGTNSAAAKGTNFSRFFTSMDQRNGIPEHELRVAVESGYATDDRWMIRVDRSRFWASGVTVNLGIEGEHTAFVKIFRDLTEAKMQLEATREETRAAASIADSMSNGIALLAHELRNPLTGISLGIDLLQGRLPDDPVLRGPITAIDSNCKFAARLVDDLMQHSKIHSDGFQLERVECTLRHLLEVSVSIAKQQMSQPDRPISILVPPVEIDMKIDCMRMQQVLVNLLTNSIRYSPVDGRIIVTGTLEGSEVIVRVTDEGAGIEADKLEHLFEAFTRSRLQGTKLGLGLGLALVKKLVDLHGGTVQARSEGTNKGSQFVIRFPSGIHLTH